MLDYAVTSPEVAALPSPEVTPPPAARRCSAARRHYKKDSRFVGDLYTLTFDTNECVENLDYLELQRRHDRELLRHQLALGWNVSEYDADDIDGVDGGMQPLSLYAQFQLVADGGAAERRLWQTSADVDRTQLDIEPMYPSQHLQQLQQRTSPFNSLPPNIHLKRSRLSGPPALWPGSGGMTLVHHQQQLQTEARLALAQARRMAHWQLEVERQGRLSPVTNVIRTTFDQSDVPPALLQSRCLSQEVLSQLTLAQLTALLHQLRTRIQELNESLVADLLERDELNTEQDRQLLHIADLTLPPGQQEVTAAML